MKRNLVLIVLVTALALTLLSGCSRNKAKNYMPVKQKMEMADNYFAIEKYHKAIPLYTDIVFERNSKYTAKAQMQLAECFFNQNKFLSARFEYEEMIRLFGDYDDIARAYFQIGVCNYENSLSPHYTQEETLQAIDAFQTFIEKFPFDGRKVESIDYINKCNIKLLEKKYYNGYAYYKLSDYSAALMYFEEIIELGNNNDMDMNSLYYASRIYIFRKDVANADKYVEKFMGKYSNTKLAPKLQKYYNKKIK